MKYVIRDHEGEADAEAPLGGKARALAALREADLPIPGWFAVGPEAFNDSLSAADRVALEAGDGPALQRILEALRPSDAVTAESSAEASRRTLP